MNSVMTLNRVWLLCYVILETRWSLFFLAVLNKGYQLSLILFFAKNNSVPSMTGLPYQGALGHR